MRPGDEAALRRLDAELHGMSKPPMAVWQRVVVVIFAVPVVAAFLAVVAIIVGLLVRAAVWAW